MEIRTEISSFDDFKAWSGGKDTLDDISAEKQDQLFAMLEDLFPEGCTDTELNDFLWFERDQIYEMLGLDENGKEPEEYEPTNYKLIGFDGDTFIICCKYEDEFENLSEWCDENNVKFQETDELYDDDEYHVDYEDDLKFLICPVYQISFKNSSMNIYFEDKDELVGAIKECQEHGFSMVKVTSPKDEDYDYCWCYFDIEEFIENAEV